MMTNHQRKGATSNSQVGKDFEETARCVLQRKGVTVEFNHPVLVGCGKNKKAHKFDLGSDNPPVIVECKSHKWTEGNNVPSAKMTVWNEAMYYFAVAPKKYRKILFVLKDKRKSNQETLAEYYLRRYDHLIPRDVEIWEYDTERKRIKEMNGKGVVT